MSVKLLPALRRFKASCRWCGVSLGGRPVWTPFALARDRPSPVRAKMTVRRMNIDHEISPGDMVIPMPYGTAEWHDACNASKPVSQYPQSRNPTWAGTGDLMKFGVDQRRGVIESRQCHAADHRPSLSHGIMDDIDYRECLSPRRDPMGHAGSSDQTMVRKP